MVLYFAETINGVAMHLGLAEEEVDVGFYDRLLCMVLDKIISTATEILAHDSETRARLGKIVPRKRYLTYFVLDSTICALYNKSFFCTRILSRVSEDLVETEVLHYLRVKEVSFIPSFGPRKLVKVLEILLLDMMPVVAAEHGYDFWRRLYSQHNYLQKMLVPLQKDWIYIQTSDPLLPEVSETFAETIGLSSREAVQYMWWLVTEIKENIVTASRGVGRKQFFDTETLLFSARLLLGAELVNEAISHPSPQFYDFVGPIRTYNSDRYVFTYVADIIGFIVLSVLKNLPSDCSATDIQYYIKYKDHRVRSALISLIGIF